MRFPDVSALSSLAVKNAQSLADQLDEDPDRAEIPKELSGFTLYAEGKSFYKTMTAGRERYILVFNPALYVTRRQDREARVAKAEAEIAEINRDTMSARGNRGADPVLRKAEKILHRLALAKVAEPVLDEALITCGSQKGRNASQIKTYRVRLVPHADAAGAELYDGLCCLCTDVPKPAFSRTGHSGLPQEERRGRGVQGHQIRGEAQAGGFGPRPGQWAHYRVCSHISFTALEEALKTSGSTYKQPDSALRKLSECTVDEYQFSGMAQPARTLTRPTVEHMAILKELGLEGIVGPMRMNPILKSQAYINPDPPSDEAGTTV